MSCGQNLKQHIIEHEILGITASGIEVTASGSNLIIRDEGSVVSSNVECINFIGADVLAESAYVGNCVNVYIPPPTFVSHWNTNDGTNGAQYVTDSVSRTEQRISTPSSGEGNPFKTGGWAATNQDATLDLIATFTTPNETTGWGGNSTMVVRVYDATGSLLETFTTPSITGNGIHTSISGNIEVTITLYSTDATKYKAKASVEVDFNQIFLDQVPAQDGGRFHIEIDHITDTLTDGAQTFSFVQDDVFLDTNATTPSINGTVSIVEGSTVLTKHLSGIEYYILGSQFNASVQDIDQLNRNTQATSGNLYIEAADYGLPGLNQSPFGTGSGNFSGWNNNENTDNVNWNITGWAITQSNYRFIGTTGNASSRPKDGWANGSTVNGANANILIDTYLINSTNTYEPFDDENRRQQSDYTTAWNSTVSLGAGEALVQNSYMMVPNQSTYVGESSAPNANWTSFKPDLGGTNPNYSGLGLGSGISYYRTFPDTVGIYRPNMTLTFSGIFFGGNALTDLTNQYLEIFVRKVAGIGNFGKVSPPLLVHGQPYNAGTFDDGNTDGYIRLGSSTGNTINCTFGTFTMKDGIYMEIKIRHNTVKINSITVTFT